MKNQFVSKTLTETGMAIDGLCIQCTPSSTSIHWHSCAEMIHLRRGEALVFVGERWQRLCAGDTVFIPPGHLHCCECTDITAVRVVVGLEEGGAFSSDLFSDTPSALALRGGAADALLLHGGRIAELLACVRELPATPSPCERIDRSILIHELYREFLYEWHRCGYLTSAVESRSVSRALERIIALEYREPLRATEVCRRLNMSYSHMAALLRAERGLSFEGLVLSYRIEAAKRLLLTTDKSITEIAMETGFTDSSYFIKKFRLAEGTTPHKYKSNHLRKATLCSAEMGKP